MSEQELHLSGSQGGSTGRTTEKLDSLTHLTQPVPDKYAK
jgi:hypothetical protein